MNEPMGPQYFLPIEYDELAKLRARTAGAEREAAQEKARNAELVEQLRVAREATREAVDREGALVTQCNYARDKVERLERWLASAKEQHLADVGTLSRCLEARDKRVAELEDAVKHYATTPKVPAGYVRESWVRMNWDAATEHADHERNVSYPRSLHAEGPARLAFHRAREKEFTRLMGWPT